MIGVRTALHPPRSVSSQANLAFTMSRGALFTLLYLKAQDMTTNGHFHFLPSGDPQSNGHELMALPNDASSSAVACRKWL